MVILGLDPGIARCGYGVVQGDALLAHGCLTTDAGMPTERRLAKLGEGLIEVLQNHQPDQAVVELVFFGANRKSAMVTAQVIGILLYLLEVHGVKVKTITPPQVKRALTGFPYAGKGAVEMAARQRLGFHGPIGTDDAADAVAVALCG